MARHCRTAAIQHDCPRFTRPRRVEGTGESESVLNTSAISGLAAVKSSASTGAPATPRRDDLARRDARHNFASPTLRELDSDPIVELVRLTLGAMGDS